jgi:hypothetical protein
MWGNNADHDSGRAWLVVFHSYDVLFRGPFAGAGRELGKIEMGEAAHMMGVLSSKAKALHTPLAR